MSGFSRSFLSVVCLEGWLLGCGGVWGSRRGREGEDQSRGERDEEGATERTKRNADFELFFFLFLFPFSVYDGDQHYSL